MGGIIEASHDENGIIWPKSVAPFGAGVLNLKPGHEEADKVSEDIYNQLVAAGVDPLLDDEKGSIGVKFSRMDLIGLPYQIAVGPRGLKEGSVEVKTRATGEKQNMTPEEAINFVTAGFA